MNNVSAAAFLKKVKTGKKSSTTFNDGFVCKYADHEGSASKFNRARSIKVENASNCGPFQVCG